MKAKHVLCPLVALLDKDEEKTYGAGHDGKVVQYNPTMVWVMTLIWLVSFVLAIVGMFKAFSCGAVSTNFGLTGTGWGVIILVLGLLITPIGGLLGVAFAIGGTCAPKLFQM
jgi:uncharacterized membrane protein